MRRTWWITALLAALVAIAAVGGWLVVREPEGRRGDASPAPEPTTPAAEPVRPKAVGDSPQLRRAPAPSPDGCVTTARAPFVPRTFDAQGVVVGADVLALPRDARGVPGVPPVSDAGKDDVGFDAPGSPPGSRRGNTILTIHTWPDGSALGNRLLAGFGEGDRLVLRAGGKRVCYRVSERLKVLLEEAPVDRVYDVTGPPQVVIIVCSGTRLGPGNWTHRTLWFARPVRS